MNKKVIVQRAIETGVRENPYRISGDAETIRARMTTLYTDSLSLSIYKTYDCRWDLKKQPAQVGYWIGRAFAQTFPEGSNIIMSYDAREVSKELHAEVIAGIKDAGRNVLLTGSHGTGVLKFAALYTYLTGKSVGGIQITGSHCEPATISGIKMITSGRPFSRGDIEKMRDVIWDRGINTPAQKGDELEVEIDDSYFNYAVYIARNFGKSDVPLQGLNVYFDNGKGSDAQLYVRVLESLGANVKAVNMEEHVTDGQFLDPNEPDVPYAKQQLATYNAWAKTVEGPTVFIYGDPDKDRAGIFGLGGPILASEHLKLTVLANKEFQALNDPNQRIVVDIRAAVALRAYIRKLGMEDVVSAAGYAYVMDKVESMHANFGSEMTLHTFTNYVGIWMQDNGLPIKPSERASLDSLTIDDTLSSNLIVLLLAAKLGKNPELILQEIYENNPELVQTVSIERRSNLSSVSETVKFQLATLVDSHLADPKVANQLFTEEGIFIQDIDNETDGTKIILKDKASNDPKNYRLIGSIGTRVSNTGPQHCLNPEVLPERNDLHDYYQQVFLLENMRAALNLEGADPKQILLDNTSDGWNKLDATLADLITVANQHDNLYADLVPIILATQIG